MLYLPKQNWTTAPVTSRSTLNGSSSGSTARESQLTVAAENAVLRVLYGTVRVGPQIANVLSYNGNLVILAIWAQGECDSFVDLQIDDKVLPAGVTFTHYLGTSTQTVNSTLVSAFAAQSPTVNFTDAMPGICYSVIVVPPAASTGFPRLTATIKGRKVWTGSSVTWSDNPAWCLADFITNTAYGMGRTCDLASAASVAADCDVLAGGVERLRTLNLTIETVQPVTEWLDTLRTYAGCWVVASPTGLKLISDKAVGSVSASYAHDAGTIQDITAIKKRGVQSTPTVMTVQYTDTSVVPWRTGNAVVYASGVLTGTTPRRESNVSLPGITRYSQAYREATERLNKLLLNDLSFTLNVFDEALVLDVGDVIEVTHPIGLTSKPMRVMAINGEYGRYSLNLVEYDPSVYNSSVATAPSIVDTALPNPLTPPSSVTGLSVVESVYVTKDGSVASRLQASWNPSSDLWVTRYAITITRMTTAGGNNPLVVATGYSDNPTYTHGPLEDGYFYKTTVVVQRFFNLVSGTPADFVIQAVGKLLKPSDVANLVATPTPSGLILTWDPVIDIDMRGYRVKENSWLNGPLQTVDVTTVNLGYVSTGLHTYLVRAFDWSGGESNNNALIVANIDQITAPTSLAANLSTGSMQLSWLSAISPWPIAYYELRYGGASWETATLVTKDNSTSYSGPVGYTGSRTWRVKAVDVSGNIGLEATFAVVVNIPGAPSVSSSIVGTKANLTWNIAASSLPIRNYEIRHGVDFASGSFVTRTDATDYRVPITWTGARQFWISAIDSDGNVGTSSSTTVTINAPSAPTVTSALSLDTVKLAWTESVASLPLANYEIRYGASFAAGASLGKVSGTSFDLPVTFGGSRVFWVAAYDVNGNLGAASSATVTISPPTAPTVSAQVIDNNVLLSWSGSVASLTIVTYEIRRGSTWSGGVVVGTKSGGFTTIFETVGGSFTYWVAGIDSAGNVGTPAQVSANVAQPPDYILNATWNSTFSGTLSNIVVDIDGSRLMGTNPSQTWQDHFTTNGWATPQAQVSAGYPVYIEPTVSPSYYEETFDYGTILASTKVTVNKFGSNVSGTPVITCDISVSANGSSWTSYSNVWQVYAVSFRYVKVRVTCTGGQYDLSQLQVLLDSKLKNDAGTVSAVSTDAGGTVVNFNVPFIDVTSIVLTPLGTTPLDAIYDFVDVPNPTSFKVLLFNSAGTRVSGTVSWSARGY